MASILEKDIPVIQAGRVIDLINQEKNSRKKWEIRNANYIKTLYEENVEMYGEPKHPIDIRLDAQFESVNSLTKKPLAKSSEPWISDPDANRYYGYGVAPPNSGANWDLQVARGTFDGKFHKSINASGAGPSKFGKLTSSKRWMDYSGVQIFGKGHKDPNANDYSKFRSTPRGNRKPMPGFFESPSLDEESFDLNIEIDEEDLKRKCGPRINKFTDKTFGISPSLSDSRSSPPNT